MVDEYPSYSNISKCSFFIFKCRTTVCRIPVESSIVSRRRLKVKIDEETAIFCTRHHPALEMNSTGARHLAPILNAWVTQNKDRSFSTIRSNYVKSKHSRILPFPHHTRSSVDRTLYARVNLFVFLNYN